MGKLNINNGGVDTNKKMADIDERFGPYSSIEAADAALGGQGRNTITAGLTVGILTANAGVKEYWYQPNKKSGQLELIPKGGNASDNPTEGNFASFDSNGNVVDSGCNEDTFIKGVQKNGDDLTPDANGKVNVTVEDGITPHIDQGSKHWMIGEEDTNVDAEGKDAYQVAVSQGYEGTKSQWLASLKGDKGDNAVNPFKGWWPDLATLKAAITATAGDYAYVLPAAPTDPVDIYEYKSTESANNYWYQGGRTFNPANNQEFASGEELNEVYVDNDFKGGDKNVAGADEVKQIYNEINDATETSLDLSEYTKNNGFINPDNEFNDSGLYKHILIPVTDIADNDEIRITTNDEHGTIIAWLTGTLVSGQAVPFVANTQRISFSADSTTIIYDVPSTAQYLYVFASYDGGNHLPSIKLIRYESKIDSFANDINELSEKSEFMGEILEDCIERVPSTNHNVFEISSSDLINGDQAGNANNKRVTTKTSSLINVSGKAKVILSVPYSAISSSSIDRVEFVIYDSEKVWKSTPSITWSYFNGEDVEITIDLLDDSYSGTAYVGVYFGSDSNISPSDVGSGIEFDVFDIEYLPKKANTQEEFESLKATTDGFIKSVSKNTITIQAIGNGNTSYSYTFNLPTGTKCVLYNDSIPWSVTGINVGNVYSLGYMKDDASTNLFTTSPGRVSQAPESFSFTIEDGCEYYYVIIRAAVGTVVNCRLEYYGDKIDIEPTKDSDNFVTSGGVYEFVKMGSKDIVSLNDESNTIRYLNNLRRPNITGSSYVWGLEPFTLLHCSDIHADQVNMTRIVEYLEHYSDYIDDAICTGDLIRDQHTDSYAFWDNAGADNILVSTGNHEYYLRSDPSDAFYTQVTPKQVYDKFFAPYKDNWGTVVFPDDAATEGYNYYYKDYASKKIRLIVLDNMANMLGQRNNIQAIWLASVLDDARVNNLHVICAIHIGSTIVTPYDSTFFSLANNINNDGSGANSGSYAEFYTLRDAVETFIGNGGKFVCWITGHRHKDSVELLTGYRQCCIHVPTAAGGDTERNVDGHVWWLVPQGDDCSRADDTKSQDCFNIYSVDTEKGMLRLFRVGNDLDRYGRHKGMLVYDYFNRQVIYYN